MTRKRQTPRKPLPRHPLTGGRRIDGGPDRDADQPAPIYPRDADRFSNPERRERWAELEARYPVRRR